jgi:hypothetical protein
LIGVGVGLLAEMAIEETDSDLVALPIIGLPSCIAYALAPRDRVARTYVLDLLGHLAPHVSRREILRALEPGGAPLQTNAPDWRGWREQTLAPGLVAARAAA